jgi:hypothetical protein
VVLVAVILVVALRHDSPAGPAIAKSCTTPAVALSSSSTGNGRGIDYAITGPATGLYVVTVDATSVSTQGDNVTVGPRGAIAIAEHRGLPKCGASGTLPTLAEGPHQVELFRDGTLAAKVALH